MTVEWNEFNRELQNRVNDPGLRFMLGLIYERVLDVSKQQEQTSDILLALANTVGNFVSLNEVMDSKLQHLRKIVEGDRDGVDVRSVSLTND